MNDATTDDDRDVITLPGAESPKDTLISAFEPSKLLPTDTLPRLDDVGHLSPPPVPMSASSVSERGPSVFEPAIDSPDQGAAPTDPTSVRRSDSDDQNSYDLKPPRPAQPQNNVEVLAERLFSADHLRVIVQDPNQAYRFKTFLETFQPHNAPVLKRYVEMQKACKAVSYANAIADSLTPLDPDSDNDAPAVLLDESFESLAMQLEEELVNEALPGYITNRLTHLVTECLVKEITGNNVPIMRELVQGLAEVFCLSDPSLPDFPLVYASDEFYRTTQYGREFVIGRNCRFLQGPKTSRAATERIVEGLKKGREVCETILNYKRDGTAFVNLLLLAPMFDNKGNVRYTLGAQIDVSNLIVGGRGLESMEQLLAQDREEGRYAGDLANTTRKILDEFGRLLDQDELDVLTRREAPENQVVALPSRQSSRRGRKERLFLGVDRPMDRPLWPSMQLGRNGRLPGVYQNYLLVRPFPSLRITFTSPTLRIPGLLQSKLMDRIGGPAHIRDALLDALMHGQTVTAKVAWLTQSVASDEERAGLEGRPRWIHCTPMLGADERVGVWMIVMVEHEDLTGGLNTANRRRLGSIGSVSALEPPPTSASTRSRLTSSKLYADYMRREGARTLGSVRSPVLGDGSRYEQLAEQSFEQSFRDF